jgi:thioester reductase-like protein
MLDHLLGNSNLPSVYCLVRAADAKEGLLRIMEVAKRYKLTNVNRNNTRITAIPSDLKLPMMGISKLDYEQLKKNVGTIYHCGANVNHVYSYERLAQENALSIVDLIRLAFSTSPKSLHFVSTAGCIAQVNASGMGKETGVAASPSKCFGGYLLGKWVAERLLQQAFERGLNGSILRPGNIFANSKTGMTSSIGFNHALLLMKAFIDHQTTPDWAYRFEAVCVDQLAEAILVLSRDTSCNQCTLNLNNPVSLSMREYAAILGQVVDKKIKVISFYQWQQQVIRRLTPKDMVYPLSLYYQDDVGEDKEDIVDYETTQAQKLLRKSGIFFPENYEAVLRSAFDNYLALEFPKKCRHGRQAG